MLPPLTIVAIGASAGGLESLLSLFAKTRPNGRLAYVVAQHMAKDGHDELVARLMQRESVLPVEMAQTTTRLRADTVYVIPSGKDGEVHGDTLRLCEPCDRQISTPSVNTLFSSLASSARQAAIGILLSGAGSDGTTGCRTIQAHGGMTIALDPREAKFDGMPTAAIKAKAIDLTLGLDAIAAKLAALFPGSTPAAYAPPLAPMPPNGRAGLPVRAADDSDSDAVSPEQHRELLALLPRVLQATHIDFSSYKEDTLLRRIDKRKSTLGLGSAQAYLEWIERHPEELQILQRLFLVSLSSFFRNADSFDTLQSALAKALAEKPVYEPIRVWVPGCASGDEALTLAMIFKELRPDHGIEIIGSDLNPDALAIARTGRYRATAFKEMAPQLRERYFSLVGEDYQARPELLACVRYEQRDVLGGAPASGLDLVSCRNLLIYMKTPLQDQLIKIFYTALKPRAMLFIGQSESLSVVGNSLFAPIDSYHRLFQRRH